VATEYLTAENYSSVARVDVRIVSASEPTPQFARSFYSADVAENSPRGSTVANITVRTSLSRDLRHGHVTHPRLVLGILFVQVHGASVCSAHVYKFLDGRST